MAESIEQVAETLIGLCLGGAPLEPIGPEDFPGAPYDVLWVAMQELAEDGITPTPVLVAHRVAANLPALSVAELQRYVAEATGATRPLAEVLRVWRGRQLLQAGLDNGLTVEEIHSELQQEYPGPLTTPATATVSTYDQFKTRWQSDLYIDSGLVRIPDGPGILTCGPYRQEILTIGARFRHGKSSFATNLGVRWAQAGVSVRILTLEESEEAFKYRSVSLLSYQDHHPMKYRQFKRQGPNCPPEDAFTPEQLDRIRGYADTLDALPLTIEYVSPLKSKGFLRAVEASDDDVLIIDYLQQFMPTAKNETRTNVLQRAVASLQDHAVRKNQAVIMLSQLNREVDQQSRRPRNNDLRDSDYLGIGAKQVWLLDYPWRSEHRPPGVNDADYNIRVSKDNSGLEGTAHLTFHAGVNSFEFNYVCRATECPRCGSAPTPEREDF